MTKNHNGQIAEFHDSTFWGPEASQECDHDMSSRTCILENTSSLPLPDKPGVGSFLPDVEALLLLLFLCCSNTCTTAGQQ